MVTLEFIVSEKTEGQTDKKTYKQTNKQTNKLEGYSRHSRQPSLNEGHLWIGQW